MFLFIYLYIYIYFFFFFLTIIFFPSLCTYCTTEMKVLCNKRPTVVNFTIGYETVMSVKRVQTALLVFFFFFFIAFLHFPSTIRQLPCIIDTGTHKPQLLVPFAMCNCNEFLCQMITARMNSYVYDLLYLSYMYYMVIKTYSLSLSLSLSLHHWHCKNDAIGTKPGHCLTIVTWCCRKNFSQWEHSFLWQLRIHWLKARIATASAHCSKAGPRAVNVTNRTSKA